MPKLAVIRTVDNVVNNIIDAPTDWSAPHGCFTHVLQDNEHCGPGFAFDGAAFTAPEPPGVQTLTPRDFLALFTSQELDAIEDSTNSMARASKRALYTLTGDVHLQSTELLQMLAGLQAVGLLTEERASRIRAGKGPGG